MLSKSHLIPITRTISLERVPSCAFCCWSQLGQGKYLDNINSCGESETPACFSSLLVIILLITQHVLKTQPSAVGQQQSFCCWLWPGTAEPWCSAEPPHAAAWAVALGRRRTPVSGRACRKRLIHHKELYGAAVLEEAAVGAEISCPPSHPAAVLSCLVTNVSFLGDNGKEQHIWGVAG